MSCASRTTRPTWTSTTLALFGHLGVPDADPAAASSIEFWLATGAYRHLWMTASPIDMTTCRTFWTVSRDDDLDGDDAPHMAFQAQVLAEDEPVVCNQVPGEWCSNQVELSVRTDKVSIEYRRWLRELVEATVTDGPAGTRQVLAAQRRSGHLECLTQLGLLGRLGPRSVDGIASDRHHRVPVVAERLGDGHVLLAEVQVGQAGVVGVQRGDAGRPPRMAGKT